MLLEAHAGQSTCEGKRNATSINHEDQPARNDGMRQSGESESLLGVTHIREMSIIPGIVHAPHRSMTVPGACPTPQAYSYAPNATYLSVFALGSTRP